ncbi:MAG: hypothetical protein KGD66_00480 [Candidatus Lokiarchaeota archaeon]|nr:hypothetical protein [Candidatus Lokiarchaeota archaeon]
MLLKVDYHQIKKAGAIAIAFEWVEEEGPEYPLLKPMSKLTGIIAALKALEIFRKKQRRIAGCFSNNIEPATIMIIGLGTIGSNALNVFMHQRVKLIIVDKHPDSVEDRALNYVPKYLWHNCKDNIKILKSDEDNILNTKEILRNHLPNVDILFFSAIRRPSFRVPHLIDMDMLNLMKKNSILVDAGANDKDLVESSLSYPEVDKIYYVNGVWHYANDHIPTMAAKDASRILSKAILPYVNKLLNSGPINAILETPALSKGTIIAGYNYTHKYTCKKKKIPYIPVNEALMQYNSLKKRIKGFLKTI